MIKSLVYTSIFLSLFFFKGRAQNLVPNNSFEDTISAPLGGVIVDAAGWINCGNSPDYYNPGFDHYGYGFGTPNCFYTGYQNPLDGNSFAGLGLTVIPEQPCEFIGVQLTQPLIIGTKYYVSAYISQAEDWKCSTNNFCFRFFNSMYFSSTSPPFLDNFSHIRSTSINSDSINWQLIGGTFIADSAYQYLVMGNFYGLSQTDTLYCTASDLSYYYLDNVCVSSDSTTCLIPTYISEQLAFQKGISVFPNPASNVLHLKNVTGQANYRLFNFIGEQKSAGILILGDSTIDVSSLADGLYFLSIDKSTLKIIIRNH